MLILKNNSNSNNFMENYWEKNFSFPNRNFLKKRYLARVGTEMVN
jgi:hypothetical protein